MEIEENEPDDLVTRTAKENFGIKYLYPWQRMVIENILGAYECHKKLADYSPEEKSFDESDISRIERIIEEEAEKASLAMKNRLHQR